MDTNFKILLAFFAFVMTLGMLSACSKSEPSPAERIEPWVELPGDKYSTPLAYVYEFRLKDGTRCVVTASGHALTCDWRR